MAWKKFVLEDDATATPTADKIPIAGGSGRLADCWITQRRAFQHYEHIGTSRFRIAGLIGGGDLVTGTPDEDKIVAVPFVAPRGGTLDRIGVEVTTAQTGGQLIRLGIYKATSLTDLRPDALVVDAGTVNPATTGPKTATINVSLDPDALYFACVHGYILTPPTCVLACCPAAGAVPILGMPSGGGVFMGLGWVGDTGLGFGTLPDPFPSDPVALLSTQDIPAMLLRYSE